MENGTYIYSHSTCTYMYTHVHVLYFYLNTLTSTLYISVQHDSSDSIQEVLVSLINNVETATKKVVDQRKYIIYLHV